MDFVPDEKPVTITPDAPASGSSQFVPDSKPVIFKVDPPAGSGPQSNTPSNTPTKSVSVPHDYDQFILNSAHKHGLDPRMLQAVGMQESGLGRGLTKDGLSPTPGNEGHGLFQLDPASGASPDTLKRVTKDPAFATDYAAGMLSNGLKRYHGDMRMALAYYNAGHYMDDPHSEGYKQGLAYADQVLGRMDADSPLQLIKKHITSVIKRGVQAAKAGKSPIAAMTNAPEFHKPIQAEKDIRKSLVDFAGRTWDDIGNILGAQERAVGTLHEEAQSHNGLINAFKDYIKDPNSVGSEMRNRLEQNIWHPTPLRRRQLDEAEQKDSIFNDIDNFIKTNTWMTPEIRNKIETMYHSEGSRGVQTFLNQILNDPMTLLGGAEVRGITALAGHGMGFASGTMKVMDKLLGNNKAWSHLRDWSRGLDDLRNSAFGVRHDLDLAGFTPKGKQARLGIENAAIARHAERVERANKVAHDGQEAASQFQHVHGQNPVLSHHSSLIQELSDPLTTAERRKEILHAQAKGRLTNEIGEMSQRVFGNDKSLFNGNTNNLGNLSHRGETEKFLQDNKVMQAIKGFSDWGRKAIFWNPLPHAVTNVGTNVYMAGGPVAVAEGLKAMTGKLNPVDFKRAVEMGAIPTYLKGDAGGRLMEASQATMEHIEAGWRIGLMKYLDKTMGVPKTEAEKFIRGQLINHKVGDYRNQNAFVQLFKALGGPYVAFQLGIAPKLVMETLMKHPERISQIIRTQNATGYDYGGPVRDTTNLVSNPSNYLANAGGPLTKLDERPDLKKGPIESSLEFLGNYYGPANAVGSIAKSAEGAYAGRHGHTTLTDLLKEEMMGIIFGAHHNHPVKQKTLNTEKKEIQKGGG